jgi:predicted nucleic acid-binding protein
VNVAAELLLDSGALVALLDRSHELHAACAFCLDGWKGPVVSTEAVLTEATQLLARVAGGKRSCIDFFLAGGAVLVPSSAASLRRARELLGQPAGLRMDYADATLVALAEDLDTALVLTTDRAFGRYRLYGRKSFRILPTATTRAQTRASARS